MVAVDLPSKTYCWEIDASVPLVCHVDYCRTGNFSDVKTLANFAIGSISLKFQVANPLRH